MLLAQTVVILWQVWKNWRVAMGVKKAADDAYGRNFWDYLFRWSQLAIIAAYVIAGVIKPIQSKGQWFANSHFIGVQIVKTHRQNYYNALDPALKDRDVPLARDFMYERKNMWRLLMSMGVLLEIFAFLALYNRWMMAGVGFAMIMFHYMNDTFMELYFYNNEKMLWIFLVNIPGLVIGLMQLLKKRAVLRHPMWCPLRPEPAEIALVAEWRGRRGDSSVARGGQVFSLQDGSRP
ncbi:MAG: hypothetical protein R3F31_26935 [Verrucomicrobiales bacterium]